MHQILHLSLAPVREKAVPASDHLLLGGKRRRPAGEGRGHIYIVEPTGPFEDDPNLTDQRFPGNPTRSYRTRDPLRVVAEGVKRLHAPDKAVLLITHYQRMLNYITPDHVHILMDGRLVRSGDADLAREVEARGYDWLKESA